MSAFHFTANRNASAQHADATLLAYSVVSLRWTERQIPLSHASHVRGFAAVPIQRSAVAFESALEREAILAVARIPTVITIVGQPVTVRYRRRGRTVRYTPDLLVQLVSIPRVLVLLGFGKVTIVEVKPEAILARESLRIMRRLATVAVATGYVAIAIGESAISAIRIQGVRHEA